MFSSTHGGDTSTRVDLYPGNGVFTGFHRCFTADEATRRFWRRESCASGARQKAPEPRGRRKNGAFYVPNFPLSHFTPKKGVCTCVEILEGQSTPFFPRKLGENPIFRFKRGEFTHPHPKIVFEGGCAPLAVFSSHSNGSTDGYRSTGVVSYIARCALRDPPGRLRGFPLGAPRGPAGPQGPEGGSAWTGVVARGCQGAAPAQWLGGPVWAPTDTRRGLPLYGGYSGCERTPQGRI